MQDAACSPIKLTSGTFGKGIGTQDTNNKAYSLTSSAAADLRFVGETSYRSSLAPVGAAHDTISAVQRAPAEPQQARTPLLQSQKTDPLQVTGNQNFLMRSNFGNSNPNIFQSLKSTEIKSHSNLHQVNNHSARGNRPWARGDQRSGSGDVSRQQHSQVPSTPGQQSSEKGTQRLTHTIVQVRQALQEAAEISGAPKPVNVPKHRMQLNLNLLRMKDEQNQLRSSQGSVRTLISAGLHRQMSQQSSQVVRHHPDCEMVRVFRDSGQKRPNPDDSNLDVMRIPDRCAICSLSSFTVHPSVFKAQQRVKERKFLESHKELTQHLRNPLTVAKQLRKHLKLQKTVKTQFEAIVGRTGHLSIQNLNRIPLTSSHSQPRMQYLRKQPFKFKNRRSDRSMVSTAARSTKSVGGGGSRHRREVVRLRYAPHLLASPVPPHGGSQEGNARDAINIIVNEKSPYQGNQKFRRRRRSRSSEGRTGHTKVHRLLSADTRHLQARKLQRKWSDLSSDNGNVYQAKQMRNDKQRRSRYQRQEARSQGYSNRSYIPEILHLETSSNRYSSGASAQKNYQTGHFNMGELRGGSTATNNYYRTKSEQFSRRDTSEREARQRARLDQILNEKRNNMQRIAFHSQSTSSTKPAQHAKFETFNNETGNSGHHQFSSYGQQNHHVVSQDNRMPQPLRVQPHRARSQSRSSSITPSAEAQYLGSNHGSRPLRVRNQQRSELSHSVSPQSRSRSNPNNISSGHDDSGLNERSDPQAIFLGSYDNRGGLSRSGAGSDLDQQQDQLTQMILQDRSGTLRLRLSKAEELSKMVDRGVKDIQNMNSPLSSEENKKIVFPAGSQSQLNSQSDFGHSHLTEEPRVANQNSQMLNLQNSRSTESAKRFSEKRLSNENCASNGGAGGYEQYHSSALRGAQQNLTNQATITMSNGDIGAGVRQSRFSPPAYYDRIYERSQGGLSSHHGRSHSGRALQLQQSEQQIPRETFMREISGVKYDYRPLPREDGKDSYYRNAAVKENQGQYDRIYNHSSNRHDGRHEQKHHSQPRTYSMFEPLSQTSVGSANQLQVIERVQNEFMNDKFPANSTYFRVKKHQRQFSGSEPGYSRSCQPSYQHGPPAPMQAVTTKYEKSRSKSRDKKRHNQMDQSAKFKPFQLKVLREQKRAAMIPKLKNFAKRSRPRPISFDSQDSSEENDDFESARQRLNYIDMRHRGLHFPHDQIGFKSPNDQVGSLAQKRLCSHSRCSASKENAQCNNQVDIEGRACGSRSRSRISNGARPKTLAELKDSIRRLQKPTFSSKMHNFRKSMPAKAQQLGGRGRPTSRDRGDAMMEQMQDQEGIETPHCDRDAHFWRTEVEAFTNTVSVYPEAKIRRSVSRGKRSNNLNRSKLMVNDGSASANRLMPLSQLKEISKVMNHIMGVGEQVEQLKTHLQKTQNKLIKALKKNGVDLDETDYGEEVYSEEGGYY